jgi:hypothetical protein
MALVDLPPGAQLDAPGALRDLPPGAQLDTEQLGGFMRYPAMAGSELVKGALKSAGALGDLENWTHSLFTRGIYDPLYRMVTGQPASRALAATPGNDPLTGQPATDVLGRLAGGGFNSTNLVAGGKALGAVDRPDLIPQTTGEKYLASTAEGVGGALPFLPLGGTNPASLLRGATQGGVAGAAGEAGAQVLPEHADAARAVAGLLGFGVGGKAFDLVNKAASAARGLTSPVVDAYRNLGIEPTLAGDVTGSPFMQQLQALGGKSLAGGGRVGEARNRAIDQWGQALDETATGYGAARTPQEAGAALQDESRAWMQQWRQAQQTAEQAVAAKVPVTATVDLAPVNQVLNAATRRMPGLPSVAGIHDNPTFQNLRTALATDAPTGTARWEDIRQWRTAVGEELERSLLSGDGNQAAWRQLYGSLSRSLGDTAFAHNAHDEWRVANEITSQGHQFVENAVGKFINARNPTANTIAPEDAYRAAMRGSNVGGSTLQDIRQQMPAAADELAAYKLRSAGSATLQNAPGTAVSPRTLVSNLSPQKLAPEARDALFASDPDLARRVQDLTTVGERMRATEQFVNTANTGGYLGTMEAIMGMLAAPAAAVGAWKAGSGGPLAAASALGSLAAPLLPGYIAGRATTSPALTRFLAAPTTPTGPTSLPTIVSRLYPELRGLLGY